MHHQDTARAHARARFPAVIRNPAVIKSGQESSRKVSKRK